MKNGFPRYIVTIAALIAFVFGCSSAERVKDPLPGEEPVEDDPSTYLEVEIEIPEGGEGATESISGISDRDCVGRLDPGDERIIDLADWKVTKNGYRLSFQRTGEEAPLVLGVIADIKEDTGENMFNIGRVMEWWRSEGVDAVVLPGDGGETEEGLWRVFSTLAEPGWPVFVINGNREAREDYLGAMERAQEEYENLFNIAQQRVVDLPGATLVALPGYHDPRYLHAETGCRYYRWDVASLVPKAREAESPVVLVAHSGPRGATTRAIDYARGAGNVGDPNINRLIESAGIPFGIFAHIHEAGGKATDMLGDDVLPQDELLESFYLNVGPVDSLPWAMNDGTESLGMAGLVRFEGEKASYQINRLRALTAEQSAKARELEPSRAE